MLICIGLVFSNFILSAQEATPIDIQKARALIGTIDKQFSKDYYNGDSVALTAHYASDGQYGCLKGNDILAQWGKSIRNSIKNNTRHLIFTTTTLTADAEFLVEVGFYEIKDDNGNVKSKGKYLVVWKQESGAWRIYRDIGL